MQTPRHSPCLPSWPSLVLALSRRGGTIPYAVARLSYCDALRHNARFIISPCAFRCSCLAPLYSAARVRSTCTAPYRMRPRHIDADTVHSLPILLYIVGHTWRIYYMTVPYRRRRYTSVMTSTAAALTCAGGLNFYRRNVISPRRTEGHHAIKLSPHRRRRRDTLAWIHTAWARSLARTSSLHLRTPPGRRPPLAAALHVQIKGLYRQHNYTTSLPGRANLPAACRLLRLSFCLKHGIVFQCLASAYRLPKPFSYSMA